MPSIFEQAPEGYTQDQWDEVMSWATRRGCEGGAEQYDVSLTAWHMMQQEAYEPASILWMGKSLRGKLPR